MIYIAVVNNIFKLSIFLDTSLKNQAQ